CLLFQSPGTETIWTATGMRDLKHFNDKCKKHESFRSHLTNSLKLLWKTEYCRAVGGRVPNWHSKTCSIIQFFSIYSALNYWYHSVFLTLFCSKPLHPVFFFFFFIYSVLNFLYTMFLNLFSSKPLVSFSLSPSICL